MLIPQILVGARTTLSSRFEAPSTQNSAETRSRTPSFRPRYCPYIDKYTIQSAGLADAYETAPDLERRRSLVAAKINSEVATLLKTPSATAAAMGRRWLPEAWVRTTTSTENSTYAAADKSRFRSKRNTRSKTAPRSEP